MNLLWFLCTNVLKTYHLPRTTSFETVLKETLSVVFIHICSISLVIVVLEYHILKREVLFSFYSVFLTLLLFWRFGFFYLIRVLRKVGFNFRNVIIVGFNERAEELKRVFESSPEYGYRFIGFFANQAPAAKQEEVIGEINEVEGYIKQNQIDEIYYAQEEQNNVFLRQLVSLAERESVKVKLVPDLSAFAIQEAKVDYYHHLPIISFRKEPLEQAHNQLLKRMFDVAFSLVVIVLVLSWLVPILALLIKLDSRGPVFFRQKRTGKDNLEFWCLKFRTMYQNKEADTKQAIKNDNRITPLGSFLRKTNLDELPQFFNVLVGDMSVVGPRPHMLRHTEEFSNNIENYMVRHLIKPGITGLAQAKGYRGETATIWDIKSRVKVDIFYIEHWSFLLDLKVIYLTLLQMVRGDERAY